VAHPAQRGGQTVAYTHVVIIGAGLDMLGQVRPVASREGLVTGRAVEADLGLGLAAEAEPVGSC
jgi:hypothetical protein